MGYVEYLKQMLRPLGVYALEGGYNGAELAAVGSALDDAWAELEEAMRESVPLTAESWGIYRYEDILPVNRAVTDIHNRRGAVIALMNIDESSFTLKDLNSTLSGCGIMARIWETEENSAAVSFPETRGIPDNFEVLKRAIEEILPCHIQAEYVFIYVTWSVLENREWTWAALEREGYSWKLLEKSE